MFPTTLHSFLWGPQIGRLVSKSLGTFQGQSHTNHSLPASQEPGSQDGWTRSLVPPGRPQAVPQIQGQTLACLCLHVPTAWHSRILRFTQLDVGPQTNTTFQVVLWHRVQRRFVESVLSSQKPDPSTNTGEENFNRGLRRPHGKAGVARQLGKQKGRRRPWCRPWKDGHLVNADLMIWTKSCGYYLVLHTSGEGKRDFFV